MRAGDRPRLTTNERAQFKQLERENVELRRANEILRLASVYLAKVELGCQPSDGRLHRQHRERSGVQPICTLLLIAPPLYYEFKALERDPERRPERVGQDERLGRHMCRMWREDREVHGVRKLRKQPRREGRAVVPCTVARLMRRLGLVGGGSR
jgi:hypothetical protein